INIPIITSKSGFRIMVSTISDIVTRKMMVIWKMASSLIRTFKKIIWIVWIISHPEAIHIRNPIKFTTFIYDGNFVGNFYWSLQFIFEPNGASFGVNYFNFLVSKDCLSSWLLFYHPVFWITEDI